MRARIGGLLAWGGRVTGWVMRTRLGRTFRRYSETGGPLLAQGLAYQSLFALFAALWVAFALFGLWIGGDSPLQQAIIDTIASAVPGLIDIGEGGAIQLDALLSASVLGWTGAIAAVGLIWTAIGWFDAARTGMRSVLGQPRRAANPVLLKLVDLGLAVGFGLAVLVSAALSLLSTSLLGAGFSWIGVEDADPLVHLATRAAGLVIAFGFDFGILLALYRVLAADAPSWRSLLGGAALAAFGIGVLKALGGALLGGASRNPLLASFTVLIGLLIWFSLVCQVLLLAAAWIGEARARRGRPSPPGTPAADVRGAS